MPGVSGLENIRGPPTSGLFANDPGDVPSATVDGLCPDGIGAPNRASSEGATRASPFCAGSTFAGRVSRCALYAGLPGPMWDCEVFVPEDVVSVMDRSFRMQSV
jgi:hypothetical protein